MQSSKVLFVGFTCNNLLFVVVVSQRCAYVFAPLEAFCYLWGLQYVQSGHKCRVSGNLVPFS